MPVEIQLTFQERARLKALKKVSAALWANPMYGEPISLATANDLTEAVWKAIGSSTVDLLTMNALRLFLHGYIGQTLDKALIECLSFLIAGWRIPFLNGMLFEPWSIAHPVGWNLLRVEDIERIPVKHRRMYRVVFKGYEGNAVGQYIELVLPGAFMQQAIRQLGGLKYAKYLDEDISRLWMVGTLLCNDGRVRVERIGITGAYLRRNKTLLKSRQSMCPHPAVGAVEKKCYNCHLSLAECSLSRHLVSWKKGVCINTSPRPHRGYIVTKGLCRVCLQKGVVPPQRKVD